MQIWIDAQLSPAITLWINNTYDGIEAKSLRSIGLRDAKDVDIFFEARKHNAIVITKDADFIKILEQFGSPPKVIWVTCGNTSNEKLRTIFSFALPKALDLLSKDEDFVEVSDVLIR